MKGSIALTEAPGSPVSPDIGADAHHLLDLHVPLSETGLGVIVLVAGDSDVSATEKEIAQLKLMHSPVVRCRCLFLPFNNRVNHSSAISNHKDPFRFWKYPSEIIPLLECQRVL